MRDGWMTDWRQQDYQNTHTNTHKHTWNHRHTHRERLIDHVALRSEIHFKGKEKERKKAKTTYADDCTQLTHGHLLCSVHRRRHLLLVLMMMVVMVMVMAKSANEKRKGKRLR